MKTKQLKKGRLILNDQNEWIWKRINGKNRKRKKWWYTIDTSHSGKHETVRLLSNFYVWPLAKVLIKNIVAFFSFSFVESFFSSAVGSILEWKQHFTELKTIISNYFIVLDINYRISLDIRHWFSCRFRCSVSRSFTLNEFQYYLKLNEEFH